MSLPVTRDLDDPEFPHGEERGWRRGCRRDCCRVAHAKRKKQRDYLARRGQGSEHPAAPLRARLHWLLEQGATIRSIAKATGLSVDTLYDVNTGKATKVRSRTQERLAALTLEQAREHVSGHVLLPSARSRQQVYSMMAQGWMGSWIVHEAGNAYTGQTGFTFIKAKRQYVEADTARKIDALARRIGNAEGTSKHARTAARKRGYWPLAAYDDDGNLDLRHFPGHPWAEADDMCGRLLDMMSWWLDHPAATDTEVAHEHGREGNEVKRLRQRMESAYGRLWRDRVRKAVAAYEDGADGTVEALRAGLALVGNIAATQVPPDHPVAVEGSKRRGVSQAS